MLEKKVPFCIDHFSIATTHRDRPIDLVTKLGFTTADCYTDRTVHFIFENSYFELCTYQLNTTITWLTQSVPATNLPKVHSYRLSVKGTDPNPMRNALIEGGIETIGEINNPFRQHVRYGEKEGEAGYQTFFIQNYEPFTDILFGCTTHLAKELIVKNETKFPHINGAKHGLKGIPRSQLPKVRSMLKQIYMLAPLIFLIFCMAVFNMTIVRSGLLTIIVTLVLVEINPKTRMTKEQWLQIPVQTVKSAVSVGIACAMAGIISGVIMGSGLGYRISSILTSVAGTSMLLLLVLTMVVSLIMGMGVPTTAAYLVLASLVAPTMIQLGIPPLAAHMFIFYFGCISSITPPVALAAYAGAGLAGCDPNKTGYKAFRLAFCSFLMPYLFVYNPVLLMEGGVLDILWSLVTALIGAYLLASGFEGFFFRWSLKWFERPLMILGAVMLIVPGMVTDLVGIAIIVVEFVTEFMFKRSEKFVPVTVSQSTT